VPVRIALDKAEVSKNPLRVGLSMEVTVDVADENGLTLADTPPKTAVASTTVFDSIQHDADAEVARIVAANGGGKMAGPRAPAPAASASGAADATEQVASAGSTKARRHHK